MPKQLEGKIAVITGGTSGIGLATAKRFVEEGAHVFITGRTQKELDRAVVAIGKNVTGVRADVLQLEDIDGLYRTVAANKSTIDVVFANAGFVELKGTLDVTPDHFDRTFDTNARGVYFTVQKALPLMNDGGSIILTASCNWPKGFPLYGTYSATKAALRSFARTWTTELKDRKIRTNVISPGAIDTPIIDSQVHSKEASDELKAKYAALTPLGRVGRSEEVASAALFLASSESSYVAGIDLPVDGGITAV
jgi:NAD(P)-dependent dehydrogenase (short-subunit alcohol dehydrogenase family)